MSRPTPRGRSDYPWFYPFSTRWSDNDMYGHANNVNYYAWFDTVVNRFLIEEGDMKPLQDPVVGFVVASACDYFAPISHPAELELGLCVTRLGSKSVAWEIGVFVQGDEATRATGRFTHAFVERAANKSARIPTAIEEAIIRADLIRAA